MRFAPFHAGSCSRRNRTLHNPCPQPLQVYHQMQSTPGCAPDAGTHTTLIRILEACEQYPQVCVCACVCVCVCVCVCARAQAGWLLFLCQHF